MIALWTCPRTGTLYTRINVAGTPTDPKTCHCCPLRLALVYIATAIEKADQP